MINDTIAENINKINRLNDLKQLLIDLCNYCDIRLIVHNNTITVEYENFAEGYEQFIVMVREYITNEISR